MRYRIASEAAAAKLATEFEWLGLQQNCGVRFPSDDKTLYTWPLENGTICPFGVSIQFYIHFFPV